MINTSILAILEIARQPSTNISDILKILIPPVITIVAAFVSYKGIKKQLKNDPQHAKDYLPVLIQLINNLDILKMALVYEGRYCPMIEHRVPSFSEEDGDSSTKMSYAQRSHFFYCIGLKIIENCRKVIFLTPSEDLPGVIKKAKEIKDFLNATKVGEKSTLEKIQLTILHAITGDMRKYGSNNAPTDCTKYSEELLKLCSELENEIEQELPQLRKK